MFKTKKKALGGDKQTKTQTTDIVTSSENQGDSVIKLIILSQRFCKTAPATPNL